MKRKISFFQSLEIYTWKVIGRSPLPYSYLILGLVMMVVVASLFGNSLAGASSMEEVIRKAAQSGDYALAQRLLNQSTKTPMSQGVLGVNSELEELVYPEKTVERRIAELEAKLIEYPGNREIYLGLVKLYDQIGKREEAEKYQEMAKVLDPNE